MECNAWHCIACACLHKRPTNQHPPQRNTTGKQPNENRTKPQDQTKPETKRNTATTKGRQKEDKQPKVNTKPTLRGGPANECVPAQVAHRLPCLSTLPRLCWTYVVVHCQALLDLRGVRTARPCWTYVNPTKKSHTSGCIQG